MKTYRNSLCLAFAMAITLAAGTTAFAVEREGAADALASSRTTVQLAPIRSQANLAAYLASPAAARSALGKMSLLGKKRFLAGLTFNERGLTGYRFSDLEAELSPSDIYRVLSLFGAEHTAVLLDRASARDATDRLLLREGAASRQAARSPGGAPELAEPPTDYKWMKCTKRATCSQNEDYICMSSC